MLEYNRIDISEGPDINNCKETSARCTYVIFIIF